MKRDEYQENWFPIPYQAAYILTGATSTPGVVHSFPTGELPSGMKKLPGLEAAFVSGYINTKELPGGVTAIGEISVRRNEGTTGKGYVWLIVVDGSQQVCFGGPYKYFSGHHFAAADATPVEKLFGNVPGPSGEKLGT